jgi:2-oxoglutarate dehydrogenase E2 component (dihydrolipoamide succinyltransferase)
MSIKVTFEFETAADAAAFLQDASEGGIPAPTQAAKRQRKSAAADAPAAPAAAPAAAASAPAAQPASASPAAVPFKAVADAITALADKDLAAAKGVLQSFGVAKAGDLKPEQYAACVEACQKALNPTPAAATSLI